MYRQPYWLNNLNNLSATTDKERKYGLSKSVDGQCRYGVGLLIEHMHEQYHVPSDTYRTLSLSHTLMRTICIRIRM